MSRPLAERPFGELSVIVLLLLAQSVIAMWLFVSCCVFPIGQCASLSLLFAINDRHLVTAMGLPTLSINSVYPRSVGRVFPYLFPQYTHLTVCIRRADVAV